MKRVCGPSADRITNLPVDVIQQILMFLPIKHAAKTSTLSTRWRHHWRSIPKLVFDRRVAIGSGGSISTDMMNKSMFNIFKALLLHDGPIKKFVLSCPGLKSCYGNEIDEIVVYLSHRDLQEFMLFCAAGDSQKYKLHSSLFSCIQLNRLRLDHCEFGQPSWFVGFSMLTVLLLSDVTLPSDFCENFLVKCPMLKDLRLVDCDGLSNLNIVAPCLERFCFTYRDLQKICFKCTPVLYLVSFRLCRNLENTADMIALLASLPALQKFSVDFGLPQHLAVGDSDFPSRLPTPLHRLEILHTRNLDFSILKAAHFFVCLITSSPNLRELTIKLHRSQSYQPADSAATTSIGGLLEAEYRQGSGNRFLQQLRVFEMEECLGTQVELDLVKFVLATGPVLERIHIPPSHKLTSEKLLLASRIFALRIQIHFLDLLHSLIMDSSAALYNHLKSADPFFLLAGPNVIESEEHIFTKAKHIKAISTSRASMATSTTTSTPPRRRLNTNPHAQILHGGATSSSASTPCSPLKKLNLMDPQQPLPQKQPLDGGCALVRDWAGLSPELFSVIMAHLSPADRLGIAQLVCSSWRKVCRDPYIWRSVNISHYSWERVTDVEALCAQAVDRSCGGLVSLSLECFGSDKLLADIASK
ncbi:unnamed protein product [Linum tenue]|uniref:F-box domain-containing protein n=1 Tax=Linum tenue TaxID=586396 RepID=A0AAV0NI91_9ROSI|nr:unnamed protein product [Linum tenue]